MTEVATTSPEYGGNPDGYGRYVDRVRGCILASLKDLRGRLGDLPQASLGGDWKPRPLSEVFAELESLWDHPDHVKVQRCFEIIDAFLRGEALK